MNLQQIQAEQKVWRERNFPTSTELWVPAMGVAEEIGEAYLALAMYVGHEEWRDIPGFETVYQISSLGRVKRIKGGQGSVPGRILKGSINKDGYIGVNLYLGAAGWKMYYGVHQLVAMAFIGPCPSYYEVNHKDENKLHNYPYNLEYVSHQDNIRHSIALSHPWGFHPELTIEIVTEIRLLLKQGISNKEIAKHFDIDPSTVSRIKTGDHYYNPNEPDRELVIKSGVVAAGELCHSILKMIQGIRGTEEEHLEAIKDAIGDISIYLIDMCNMLNIDFESVIQETWKVVRERDWQKYPKNGRTE